MREQAITNWRELKAGIEMSRLIAERLGWTLTFESYWWRLARPDGYEFEFTIVANEVVNTDFVWGHCIKTMPRLQFSTNLNTAFTLIDKQDGFNLSRDTQDNVWMADFDTVPPVYETAQYPALAICRAWLAYQDGKQTE